MGKVAYDERELAFVQLAAGKFDAGALDDLIARIDQAAITANGRRKTMQWITIIDDTAEPPSAVARKRIVEAMRRFEGLDCATVVTSPFQRAVVTAFTWLRTSSTGHRFGVFATEAAATTWLESFAGPRPVWKRLLAEARFAATSTVAAR